MEAITLLLLQLGLSPEPLTQAIEKLEIAIEKIEVVL